MLLEIKCVSEEVKPYLRDLYNVLKKGDLEQWYERIRFIVDYGCYFDPTLWELVYEDYKKLKEILELCIKLKNCLERLK